MTATSIHFVQQSITVPIVVTLTLMEVPATTSIPLQLYPSCLVNNLPPHTISNNDSSVKELHQSHPLCMSPVTNHEFYVYHSNSPPTTQPTTMRILTSSRNRNPLQHRLHQPLPTMHIVARTQERMLQQRMVSSTIHILFPTQSTSTKDLI